MKELTKEALVGLTKEQAIAGHRKMWNWIAKQYKKGSKEVFEKLKRTYCREQGIKNLDKNLESDCFCCEYALQEAIENEERFDPRDFPKSHGSIIHKICKYCPIDFCGNGKGECRDCGSPLNRLVLLENLVSTKELDADRMAGLALEVANLPER